MRWKGVMEILTSYFKFFLLYCYSMGMLKGIDNRRRSTIDLVDVERVWKCSVRELNSTCMSTLYISIDNGKRDRL